MNRMDKIFNEYKAHNKKILILYFPIGDSILNNEEIKWANTYFSNGATILEIGLPYENPTLDGERVRASMGRALSNTTLDNIFDRITGLRRAFPNNILQIMTYYEVIQKYGIARFADICHRADIDGVLSPNIPPNILPDLRSSLDKYNIYLLEFAPYSLDLGIINRLRRNISGGYIFQQAVDGMTGEQQTVSPRIKTNIELLKNNGITVPVCAGFGISNPQQAEECIAMGADGIIIGSAMIKQIMDGNPADFIKSISYAINK